MAIIDIKKKIPEMALRDYFAGQVLAGIGEYLIQNRNNLESLAQSCYNIADAMIEIRNKK